MKLSEWNKLLFRKLVVDTGRPGDPLYLYVDAEVLADVGGFDDADAALEDFKQNFEGYDFHAAEQDAIKWKRAGFQGDPPFVTALAMTVLAVTLEPIENKNFNVYRRQWELLGKNSRRNNRHNAPAHYTHVPNIWNIWNQFLQSDKGSRYGVPTARRGHLTYQGWARSQSFVRARDKQDIYAFLRDSAEQLPDEGTADEGERLVSLLRSWLRTQGSRSRLARAAANSGLHDELGGVLVAQRSFWSHEVREHKEQVRRGPSNIRAALHWTPSDGGVLSLVAPMEGIEGMVGTDITDFQGQQFTIDTPWHFVYLTSEEADPESWFFEPVYSYRLSDTLNVSWEPQPTYFFQRDRGGADWIETQTIDPKFEYRALIGPDGEQPESIGSIEVGYSPGPLESSAWLVVDGKEAIPGSIVSELFDIATKRSRPRNHKLVGGLPLNSARSEFLNGFEPDIRIPLDDATSQVQISLDGEDISDRMEVDGATWTGVVRLREEVPDPGRHQVTVRVDDRVNNASFLSVSPKLAPLPPSRAARHSEDGIIRFSLELSPAPSVTVIFENGSARSLEMNIQLRNWLRILDKDQELPRFESFFDSCWFDALYPLPGEQKERVLVIATGGGKMGRFAFTRTIHVKSMLDSTRVQRQWNTPASELIALATSVDNLFFMDDEARSSFQQFKKTLARDLGSKVGQVRSSRSRTHQNRPTQVGRPRSDIEAARSMANPYEDLLIWLTERRENGVTITTAGEAFAWLCEHADFPKTPEFSNAIRTLEALGHITRQGNRLIPWPASANWLPDSEALTALSGARTEDMVATLNRGEGSPAASQDDTLQATCVHIFTQVQKLEDFEKTVPAAPSTIFLQLGSAEHSPQAQAHDLGLEFFNASLAELEGIASLAERLSDKKHQIILDRSSKSVDIFTPWKKVPGGRWRGTGQSQGLPDKDAFLRIKDTRGNRYAWWDSQRGTITSCGWTVGLWGFHLGTATSDLFGMQPTKSRFAVAEHMWLPPDLERFLVMRSGLLPRIGTDQQGDKWRIYTNVSIPVAEAVSAKLGHRWGSARSMHPAELRNLRFAEGA